jgi:hypothetical protein
MVVAGHNPHNPAPAPVADGGIKVAHALSAHPDRACIHRRTAQCHMNTREITDALTTLCAELVDGAPQSGGYVLNPGDPGLLSSLDRLTAEAASSAQAGGAPIAAHVDHLRYGLSLLNRWTAGENPFSDADWKASWRTANLSEDEWARLRADLRDEAHRWLEALGAPREVDDVELAGMIGSIAHLAYHMGAIRQIDRTARGPSATG